MKEYKVKNGPFLKSNNTTSKMIKHLFISLIPIILFSFYKNGIIPFINNKVNIIGLFYPLIIIFVGTFTSFLTEYIYYKMCKKDVKELLCFSIFPGLFLSLILPLNTPISIVIFGSLSATIIGKLLFGGFGNNVFNPALIGRLFVISTYALVITNNGGYLNSYEVDTISSATPLSNIVEGIGTYETLVKPYGNLLDFFIGTIPGSLGETSALLCLLAFIYLTINKVIKWRIPVCYISTVFFMTFVIGLINSQGIWYPLFQVLNGGLFFGAVFMATDPVTSPTTKFGQVLYGIGLGLLTVIFRYLTPYPEGVLTSILTMNMLVFIIDKIGAKARLNMKKYSFIPILLIVFSFLISFYIANNFDNKNKDNDFSIINKEKEGTKITYVVSQKGYSSVIKAQIIIENNKILSIDILEQDESFYKKIEGSNYIEKLINEQNNLDEVDSVSGATITSNALRKMVINTINDYKGSGS